MPTPGSNSSRRGHGVHWHSSSPDIGSMDVVPKNTGLVAHHARQAIEEFLLSLPLGTDSASAMVEQMVAQKLLDTQAEVELLKHKLHDWSNVAVELHSMVDQQHRQMHNLSLQLANQKLANQEQQAHIKTQLLPAVAAQAAAMTASMLGNGTAASNVDPNALGQSLLSTPATAGMAGTAHTPDTVQLHAIQQAIHNIMRQQAAGSPATSLPQKQLSRLSERLGAADTAMHTPISRMQLPHHIGTTVSSNGYTEWDDAVTVVQRGAGDDQNSGMLRRPVGQLTRHDDVQLSQAGELQVLRQELAACQAQMSEQQLLVAKAQDEASRVRAALMDAEMDMQRMGDSSAGLQQRAQHAEDLAASLQQQLDTAGTEVMQLKAERDAAVASNASTTQALTEAQQAATSAQKQAAESTAQVTNLQEQLEACRAALLSAQSECAALRGQMSATDGAHVKLEGVVSELRAQLEAASANSSPLHAELRQTTEQLQQAKEQLHESKEQLHQHQHQVQQNQQKLSQLEQQHDSDTQQLEELQTRVSSLQQELADVKQEHGAELSGWQQQLAMAQEVHAAADASWQQQLQAGDAALQDAASHIQQLSAALQEADERVLQLEDELAAATAEKSQLAEQLHSVQLQSNSAHEQLIEKQAELQESCGHVQSAQVLLQSLGQQLQEAQLQLQESKMQVQEIIAQLQESQETARELEVQVQEANTRLQKAGLQVRESESQVQELTAQLHEAQADVQQLRSELGQQMESAKAQQAQEEALRRAAELQVVALREELLQVQGQAADTAAAALQTQQQTRQHLEQAAAQLEEVYAALAERQHELEALQERTAASLAQQQEAAEAQQQAVDAQLQDLNEQVQAAHSQRQVAETRLLDLQEKLSAGEQEQERMAIALEELWSRAGTTEAAMEGRIATLQKQLATAEATVRHLLDELEDAQQQASTAEEKQAELQWQMQEVQAVVDAAAAESDDQQLQLAEQQESWAQSLQQLQQLQEERIELKTQLAELTSQRQQSQEQLQQQNSEVEELQGSLSKLQQEAEALKAEKAAALTQAEELRLQLSSADTAATDKMLQQLHEQQALRQLHEELQVACQTAQAQCTDLQSQVGALSIQVAQAQQQLQAAEEELAKANEQVKELMNQVSEGQQQQAVAAQQHREATDQLLLQHKQLVIQQHAEQQAAVEEAQQCRLQADEQCRLLRQQLGEQQLLAAADVQQLNARVASLQQQLVEHVAGSQAAADKAQLQMVEMQAQVAAACTARDAAQSRAAADKEQLELKLAEATAVCRQQQARLQSLEDDVEELSARLVVMNHAGHDPVQGVPTVSAGKAGTPAGMTPGGCGREVLLQEEVGRLSGLVRSLEGALLARQQRLDAAQAAADLAVEQLQRLRSSHHDAHGSQDMRMSWPRSALAHALTPWDQRQALNIAGHVVHSRSHTAALPIMRQSSPTLRLDAYLSPSAGAHGDAATDTGSMQNKHRRSVHRSRTLPSDRPLNGVDMHGSGDQQTDAMDQPFPMAPAPMSPYSTVSTLSSVGDLSPTHTHTRASRATPSPARHGSSHAASWRTIEPMRGLKLDSLLEPCQGAELEMPCTMQSDMPLGMVSVVANLLQTEQITGIGVCPVKAKTGSPCNTPGAALGIDDLLGLEQRSVQHITAGSPAQVECQPVLVPPFDDLLGPELPEQRFTQADGLTQPQAPLPDEQSTTNTTDSMRQQNQGDCISSQQLELQLLSLFQTDAPAAGAAGIEAPMSGHQAEAARQKDLGSSLPNLDNDLLQGCTQASGVWVEQLAYTAGIEAPVLAQPKSESLDLEMFLLDTLSTQCDADVDHGGGEQVQQAVQQGLIVTMDSNYNNAYQHHEQQERGDDEASVIAHQQRQQQNDWLTGDRPLLGDQPSVLGHNQTLTDQPSLLTHCKLPHETGSVVPEASSCSMRVIGDGRLSLSGSSTAQLLAEGSQSSKHASDRGFEEGAGPTDAWHAMLPSAGPSSGESLNMAPGHPNNHLVLPSSQHHTSPQGDADLLHGELALSGSSAHLPHGANHSRPQQLPGQTSQSAFSAAGETVEPHSAAGQEQEQRRQHAQQCSRRPEAEAGPRLPMAFALGRVLQPQEDSAQGPASKKRRGVVSDTAYPASRIPAVDTAAPNNGPHIDVFSAVVGEPNQECSIQAHLGGHEHASDNWESIDTHLHASNSHQLQHGSCDIDVEQLEQGVHDTYDQQLEHGNHDVNVEQPPHTPRDLHDEQLGQFRHDINVEQPEHMTRDLHDQQPEHSSHDIDDEELEGGQHGSNEHQDTRQAYTQQLEDHHHGGDLNLLDSSAAPAPAAAQSCVASGTSTPIRPVRAGMRAHTPSTTPQATPQSARSRRLHVLMSHRERELRRASAKLQGLQQQLNKLAAYTHLPSTPPAPAPGKSMTSRTNSTRSAGQQASSQLAGTHGAHAPVVRTVDSSSASSTSSAAAASRASTLATNITAPRVRSQIPTAAAATVKHTPTSVLLAHTPAISSTPMVPPKASQQQQQRKLAPQSTPPVKTPPSPAASGTMAFSAIGLHTGGTLENRTEVQGANSTPPPASSHSRDAVNLRNRSSGYAAVQAKRAAAAAAAVAAISTRAQANSSSTTSSIAVSTGQQSTQSARAAASTVGGRTPPSRALISKQSPTSNGARQPHTLRLVQVQPQAQLPRAAAATSGKQSSVMKWQQLLDSTDSED